MYGRESWTIKKAKHWRIDACWRILLRVPWKPDFWVWVPKEIKLVHPKGNQPWTFIGRADAEAEAPTLWPPDVKSRLIRKDPEPVSWARTMQLRCSQFLTYGNFKSSFCEFKKTEIVSCILSDHNVMRLEISYRRQHIFALSSTKFGGKLWCNSWWPVWKLCALVQVN